MKQLITKWGREFDKEKVLWEYPRPSMKRDSYVNLNGVWEYAMTGKGERCIDNVRFENEIVVPYSPESFLSGVMRQLKPDELLWYRRLVKFPQNADKEKRLLLHFGAVDQMCKVYINRKLAGRHIGGYLPFSIDITDYVKNKEGVKGMLNDSFTKGQKESLLENGFELIVCVKDMTEASFHSRGKQLLRRGGMFYTAQSGIWQTVWMESVPETYIRKYKITTDIISGEVEIEAALSGDGVKDHAFSGELKELLMRTDAVNISLREPYIDPVSEAEAEELKKEDAKDREVFKDRDYYSLEGGTETEKLKVRLSGDRLFISFSVPERRLWSPETPWLYYFRLRVLSDEVLGYLAFRKIDVERPSNVGMDGGVIERLNDEIMNHPRICLNYKPCFQNGVLDQGYYPEGLYTPPSYLAFIYDILKMKELGFNMLRKHLKIEPDRYYYHCDRIGMFVWQDMVNGGDPYKFWFVTYMATAFNVFRYRIFDNCYGLLSRKDKAGRREFEREMLKTADLLYNHPSITAWVIFNEGWGQFDALKMTKRLRGFDETRLIDTASGWFDQGCGDLRSQHYYFMKLRLQWCFKRATVISEYGGFPCRIEGHAASDKIYGYHYCKNLKELSAKYRRLMKKVMEPEIEKGLSATVYTQLSDIEDEVNGILTYDREICKLKL